MASFLNKYNWYHGGLSRSRSESILLNQRPGLFLVRDSQTLQGGYVLSVSENRKVCHYIITQRNGQYQIGDQTFNDLEEIVTFYRRHFLDTTTLVEAAARQSDVNETPTTPASAPPPGNPPPPVAEVQKVKAKYNFPGNDPDDLPFKKNDILTIIKKEEDQWWMARDCTGKEGMIPVNYVDVIQQNRTSMTQSLNTSGMRGSITSLGSNTLNSQIPFPRPTSEVAVPCIAEAIQDRHPTVYDPSELKFEKGDKVLVLKKLDSGIWDGQLQDGRKGTFPFRYVKLVTSEPGQVSQFTSQMHGS